MGRVDVQRVKTFLLQSKLISVVEGCASQHGTVGRRHLHWCVRALTKTRLKFQEVLVVFPERLGDYPLQCSLERLDEMILNPHAITLRRTAAEVLHEVATTLRREFK